MTARLKAAQAALLRDNERAGRGAGGDANGAGGTGGGGAAAGQATQQQQQQQQQSEQQRQLQDEVAGIYRRLSAIDPMRAGFYADAAAQGLAGVRCGRGSM
jgi:uncharacterized membrane protein YebE (DUF533 family)